MEWLLGLLPLVVFLACPLMMVFCFFGMRKAGCSTKSVPAAAEQNALGQTLPPAGQIAALRSQLGHLQAEQATIARQIDDLAAQERETSATIDDETVAMPAGVGARA